MRMTYNFTVISWRERLLNECILLEGMETQRWYAIVLMRSSKREGLVCIQ